MRSLDRLSDQDLRELIAAACAVRENAYAPYSEFRVGAALRTKNGHVHTGANVENAAFPTGVCAEVSALTAAVSCGDRDFDVIAIVSDCDPPAMPCGTCRQALFEFNPNLLVVVSDVHGRHTKYRISRLLPHGFGPRNMPPRPQLAVADEG